MFHDALVSFAERRGINMKKLNYTEDLLRVIFFWIGIFFLVSGVLSFLGISKPAVNSGIQNPDMLGTVFSITGVLLCIISAALGIYTAKLDKLHLQLIENGTKVKGLVEKVYLQKYTRYRRQIPYRILYSFTYHDKVYYHKSRLVWEKPDLKKGDLITVYVNNLGKSTVYNCNEDEKCKSIRCMEIQRLLMDKLKAERKTAYPFSALADPSANKWFTNQKTW